VLVSEEDSSTDNFDNIVSDDPTSYFKSEGGLEFDINYSSEKSFFNKGND
jgi:hypothetical protein